MRASPALPIAFSGAPGAFSEEAARRRFGDRIATLTCETLDDALRAVSAGRAGFSVVAVENSVTGRFGGLTEALFSYPLAIVGELWTPIRHCLLVAPGVRLEDVTVVTSHPSALAQCRDWLAAAGVATRASADTARAAQELSESRNPTTAVLGARVLAEIYGLEILAEGLSDRADNRTRFFVLGAEPEGVEEGTRTALLIGPITAPRVLKTLRIQLEARGARRAIVPFLGAEDGTRFVVEFDHPIGGGYDLAEAGCSGIAHRFLGSWAPAV